MAQNVQETQRLRIRFGNGSFAGRLEVGACLRPMVEEVAEEFSPAERGKAERLAANLSERYSARYGACEVVEG